MAAEQIHLRVCANRLELPLELARLPDVVGPTQRDEVAACLGKGGVERGWAAAILPMNNTDASRKALELACRAIGRAVVDDDHLVGGTTLVEDRFERLGDEALRLVGRYDD